MGPKKLMGPALGTSGGASVVKLVKMLAKFGAGVTPPGAGVTGTKGFSGLGLKGLLS